MLRRRSSSLAASNARHIVQEMRSASARGSQCFHHGGAGRYGGDAGRLFDALEESSSVVQAPIEAARGESVGDDLHSGCRKITRTPTRRLATTSSLLGQQPSTDLVEVASNPVQFVAELRLVGRPLL